MAGDGLRGIRSGTPVPSTLRESSRYISDVTTDNWGPEKVAAYLSEKYGATRRVKRIASSPRVYTNWERNEAMDLVTFLLSREQYLEERRNGKSRNNIAKEHGISGAGLLYHLRKWGIADPVIEEAELDKAPVTEVVEASNGAESAPTFPPVEQLMNAIPMPDHSETASDSEVTNAVHYINIRVPLMFEGWPDEIKDGSIKSVDRDHTIKVGAQMLQNAIAWAWKELSDILGPGDYTEQVQAFIDRKLITVGE